MNDYFTQIRQILQIEKRPCMQGLYVFEICGNWWNLCFNYFSKPFRFEEQRIWWCNSSSRRAS